MATAAELREAIEAHGVPLVTPEELDAHDDPPSAWRRVRMAAVWKQPRGLLERCGPALRAVVSLGAGVDFLLGAPAVLGPGGEVVVPEVPSLMPKFDDDDGGERKAAAATADDGGGGDSSSGPPRRCQQQQQQQQQQQHPLLVARIVDPHMASRMAAWVAWGVLTWQRRMLDYAECQRRAEWAGARVERGHNRDARDVRVGVLGYGTMGRSAAALLARMGYRVSAWARRDGREMRRRRGVGEGEGEEEEEEEGEPGIAALEDWGGGGGGKEEGTAAAEASVPGRILVRWPRASSSSSPSSSSDGAREQMRAFAASQDVLVVLLPLTRDTARCVDAALLSRLRAGACLVNGARGQHVDARAALASLDSGQLDMALLDVFDEEPLAEESPLWRHPRVVITPHSAAFTEVAAAARQVGRVWRAVAEEEEAGGGGGGGGGGSGGGGGRLARALGANLVDLEAGY